MAPAQGASAVTLEVAGREVTVTNPGKVYFPEAGITKLEVVRYYLAVADGRAPRRRRPAERARALRRTASTASPSTRSARPHVAAGLGRGRRAPLPLGPAWPRRSCRATPPRSPGWRTSGASSSTRIRCARRTSIIPTSCGSTSTRCPASSGRSSWPWPASCARPWPTSGWSAGRRPRARAASTSTCGSTAAGRSGRCGAPPSPWPARWSGGRRRSRPASGGRRSATASSSTTTRTPRTAPSPAPTRCAPRPTRASRRR